MRKTIFIASILLALASCSEESFIGDEALREANENGKAISFGMRTPAVTRAEGSAAAAALGYQFKVYAVKKTGDAYNNVFATNQYGTGSDYAGSPYTVWYTDGSANGTTSNTSNWDYVGASGSEQGTTGHKVTLTADQTIKYWDYSASQYEFVAYSETVSDATISKYQKDGFTVAGTAAQLAGLYVADKVTITDNNASPTMPATLKDNKIGDIVKFTFRAAAAKVRLGIFETIPGYAVKNARFRPSASEFTATTGNAILSGSFNGTSSSSSGTYNVTYNSTTGIAEFDATATASAYFDFGIFASASTALGETSTAPSWASGSPDYQSVLPNTDNPGNMILKVDYQLYNSVSGETINVSGAKAVVPSMYMTWNPNYAYTYLFKISDNTNGTSGTEGTSPEGLFPITFDAVTVATTDGAEVGTITTVSTPAITTYQEGSVSSAGITYANANGPIYITVNTDGTVAGLTADNIKLYTVEAGTTEADLILTTKTKTAVTSGSDVLSVLNSQESKQGITFTAGEAAKFTPTAGTTYAVEYLTIAEVTGLTAGESSVTGYYTRTGASAPYTYTEVTNADAKASSGTTYYTIVPQYKIIAVASAS